MAANNLQFTDAYYRNMMESLDGKLTPKYFKNNLPRVLSRLYVMSNSCDYYNHQTGVTGAEYTRMQGIEAEKELTTILEDGLNLLRQLNLAIKQTENEELKAPYIMYRRMLRGQVEHAERTLRSA